MKSQQAKRANEFQRKLEGLQSDAERQNRAHSDTLRRIDESLESIKRSTQDKRWWKEVSSFLRVTITSPLRLVSALIALIGLISAFSSLWPRVSVSAGEILDPHDTLKTLVTVSNDSVFSLSHVWFGCIVGEVDGADAFAGKPLPDWKKEPAPTGQPLVLTGVDIPIVRPGQKATTNEFCPIDGQKSYADVGLIVHFTYLYLFRGYREFRLVTVPGPNNTLVWMQQPL